MLNVVFQTYSLDGRKIILFVVRSNHPRFRKIFPVEHLKDEQTPRLHTWSNLRWPWSGVAQDFQLESYIMQKKWQGVGVYALWRYMCNVMTGDHYVFIRNMVLKSPQTGWAVVHNVFCWWNFCKAMMRFTEVQVQWLLRWIRGVELDTMVLGPWFRQSTACCVQEMIQSCSDFFSHRKMLQTVGDEFWLCGCGLGC